MTEALLMTVDEVATFLKINRQTVYHWIRNGTIPAYKIGHSYRVDAVLLGQWMRDRAYGRLVERIKSGVPRS